MIDSEVTAALVGQALNNEKFLSRYARIGNTDGFIKKAWSFLRSMVKELKSKGDENNELADIIMPTIKSMDRLLRMENVGESKSGKRYAVAPPKKVAEWKKPITLHDVEVLRSIGQKSINAFSSDEIKKAQKWAYKFFNEDKLGAKSPFFRAWFGEWRAHDVKTPAETTDIPQGVKINYENRFVKNKDTKWKIQITEDMMGDSLHYANKDRLYIERLLSHIDEVIEKAIYFDTSIVNKNKGNKKGSSQFMHYLYSVVEYQGAPFLAKIAIEEYNAGTSERAYNVQRIKMSTLSRAQYSQLKAAYRGNYASSVDAISIANLYDLVKSFDKDFSPAPEVSKYVLNEDGTPKVFYHGTRNNFTTFELQDKPQYGRALGDGFYFTSSYDKAFKFANGLFSKGQDRGGIIMPVYLRMQNPYVIKADADRTKWMNEYHKGNYDGIIDLKNDTYYVEGQTQIKSATDNIGTFDKTNPDIRYSLAPKKSQTNAKEAASEKKADAAKAEDDKVKELENKMQKMRERMARERAENAKVEGAKVFAKKDVEIAVKSIEGWTQEEVLSLAKGQELQGMSRAKREEMISNKNQSLDYKNLLKKKKKCGKILLYNYILRRNANETVYG